MHTKTMGNLEKEMAANEAVVEAIASNKAIKHVAQGNLQAFWESLGTRTS